MPGADDQASVKLEKLRLLLGSDFPELSREISSKVSDDMQSSSAMPSQIDPNDNEATVENMTEKEKRSRVAKQTHRLTKQQHWRAKLKEAERYLGMRQADTVEEPPQDASWAELQDYHAQKAQQKQKATPVDLRQFAPHPFHTQPVFIGIDVECYEHDNSKVTEVGIATLDSLELESLPPGGSGTRWHSKIRARHFRLIEHAHLTNGTHVQDSASKFQFPENGTEFVSLADAPRMVASCFRPPYSKNETLEPAKRSEYGEELLTTDSCRHVVLIGHDIANDFRYLRSLGYDLDTVPSHNPSRSLSSRDKSASRIDTADLHRALHGQWDPPSLASILSEYDLVAWHPHNAGNDAVYTLRAFLAIVLQSAGQT